MLLYKRLQSTNDPMKSMQFTRTWLLVVFFAINCNIIAGDSSIPVSQFSILMISKIDVVVLQYIQFQRFLDNPEFRNTISVSHSINSVYAATILALYESTSKTAFLCSYRQRLFISPHTQQNGISQVLPNLSGTLFMISINKVTSCVSSLRKTIPFTDDLNIHLQSNEPLSAHCRP